MVLLAETTYCSGRFATFKMITTRNQAFQMPQRCMGCVNRDYTYLSHFLKGDHFRCQSYRNNDGRSLRDKNVMKELNPAPTDKNVKTEFHSFW